MRARREARRVGVGSLLPLNFLALVVTADRICLGDAAFFRPKGSQLMPIKRGIPEAVSAMRELLGPLDDTQWSTCIAWLLAAWRPATTFPILVVRGEQGSGKSTFAKALRTIVDPMRPSSTAIPKDAENMAILAENCHVLNFDNASTIRTEMSDAMCRLGTGDAMIKRELYSDRDLAVFEAARPIVITSVTDAVTAADLLDRALLITLPVRERRMREEVFWTMFEQVVPSFRGMLAIAIQGAIHGRKTLELSDSIRMIDAATWATGGESAMGLETGAIEQAYLASRGEAAGVAGSDPVVELIVDWFGPDSAKWEGTASKLVDALKSHSRGQIPQGVPAAPHVFSRALDRHRPTLRAQGIEVGNRRVGGKGTRLLVIERCEPQK